MSWKCNNCETLNPDTLSKCEVCGYERNFEKIVIPIPPIEHTPIDVDTLGPKCLHSFNWGALWITFIWGIFNRVWWVLLCLIRFVNFVVAIWMGIKGNQYAWDKQKDSKTPAEFDKSQHNWNIAGWVIFALNVLVAILQNS